MLLAVSSRMFRNLFINWNETNEYKINIELYGKENEDRKQYVFVQVMRTYMMKDVWSDADILEKQERNSVWMWKNAEWK